MYLVDGQRTIQLSGGVSENYEVNEGTGNNNSAPNILSNFIQKAKAASKAATPSAKSVAKPMTGGGTSHATDVKSRMRQIEWSRGYNWDVYIDPAPKAPFNQKAFGLPVVDIQCDFGLVGQKDGIIASNSEYWYPRRKNINEIKLTLLDDENGTMEQYFEDWQNKIYSWDGTNGLKGTVDFLDDAVRRIDLKKLNSKKELIFTRSYLVFPETGLIAPNNSSGQVRSFTISLPIAGYIGKTKG